MNINKYIKQQDNITTVFVDQLTDNLAKSLFNKHSNFNLVITNQLYKLWNDAWRLGHSHAVDEVQSLFSYVDEVAEFAKESPLDRLRSEITQLNKEKSDYQSELNRINRTYKDTNGEYKPNKILNVINKDRSKQYTGIEKVRAIQTMINQENELTSLINAKEELIKLKQNQFIELSDPDNLARLKQLANVKKDNVSEVNDNVSKPTKRTGISTRDQRLINKITKQQQKLQTTKLPDNRIPINIRDTIREIEERRQTESTRGDVPLLEQTKFGKAYLDKRIKVLTNDLNTNYREALKSIIVGEKETKTVGYLSNNKQDKDINYYRRISAMLTRDDAKGMEQYQRQLSLINSKLKEIPSKEIAAINIPTYERSDFLKKRYDPQVPLTVANKQLLTELPDKAVYSREDIKNYRNKILEKVRKIKDNQSRTKRIALTEMGHAYNLGRLDYYDKQGIKFVKWNNSIEHKRRIAPDKYRKTYQKQFANLSNLLNRGSQLEAFKMDGVVCPLCQERAIYDYGYGRGIIKVEDLLNNSQSQPLLHPHCFCFLTAYNESDVKQTISVPIYISSLVNNVVKWGAVATLGTAAMYAAFKLTRPNIPRVSNVPLEQVTKTKLGEVLNNQVPIINVPLEPLRRLERIPNNVNLDRVNEVLQPIVKRNVIANAVIDDAVNVVNKYEVSNPFVTSTTKDKLDAIDLRLNNYENFDRRSLSKEELRSTINQYKQDINQVQSYINNITDGTVKLYSSIQSLKLVRKIAVDDAIKSLTDDLIPPGYTAEQVVSSNPVIRQLEDRISDVENTLRNNIGLQSGEASQYSQLQQTRDRLLSNEAVKREYIKSKRSSLSTVQRNLAKQQLPQQLGNRLDELNNNIVNNFANIDNATYNTYLTQLDAIESNVDKQLNLIVDKLTDVNLDIDYTFGKKEGLAISTSEFIKDYKAGLLEQKGKAIIIRNVLLNIK